MSCIYTVCFGKVTPHDTPAYVAAPTCVVTPAYAALQSSVHIFSYTQSHNFEEL